MSYTAPPTKATGDPISATNYNTHIKGNFEANPPHLLTTKGDLPIATAANAVTRLGVGTDTQCLVSDSTQATGRKWQNSGLVPIGGIVIWSGSAASIPSGWQICDGTNATPDLRDKFLPGSGTTYATGDTGGAATADLDHTHTIPAATNAATHRHSNPNTSTDGSHAHATGTTGTPSATILRNSSGETGSGANHSHSIATATSTDGTHYHTNTFTEYDGSHTHSLTSPTGSALSGTQAILPPYYALCYIMRMS